MRILALMLPLAACAEERAPEPAQSGPIVGAVPPEAVTPRPAPSLTPSPSPSASPSRTAALTAQGWGPLRIGMARAEVERALGPDADPNAAGGPDPERCDQFRPARAPKGMIVMVEDGRLTRVSLVRGAKLATDRGIALGTPASAVQAAYGRALRRERHEYVPPPGAYLTHWAGGVGTPDARGIRYEIGADGRVEAIHAGGPSITYVEGCA